MYAYCVTEESAVQHCLSLIWCDAGYTLSPMQLLFLVLTLTMNVSSTHTKCRRCPKPPRSSACAPKCPRSGSSRPARCSRRSSSWRSEYLLCVYAVNLLKGHMSSADGTLSLSQTLQHWGLPLVYCPILLLLWLESMFVSSTH
jgi:hypothetical protein